MGLFYFIYFLVRKSTSCFNSSIIFVSISSFLFQIQVSLTHVFFLPAVGLKSRDSLSPFFWSSLELFLHSCAFSRGYGLGLMALYQQSASERVNDILSTSTSTTLANEVVDPRPSEAVPASVAPISPHSRVNKVLSFLLDLPF